MSTKNTKGWCPASRSENRPLICVIYRARVVSWAKNPCRSRCSILKILASIRSFFLRIVSRKAFLTSSRVLLIVVVFIFLIANFRMQSYEIISKHQTKAGLFPARFLHTCFFCNWWRSRTSSSLERGGINQK